MSGGFPSLIVTPEPHEWGLPLHFTRLAREQRHPIADRLELVVDRELRLPFRDRLDDAGAVVFLAQDPLGPMYPRVYRYVLELEQACDGAGVPLLGRADPLSQTCKSRQLQLLRRAGLRAPRAVRLAHWRDALAGDRVGFPLVLRYDCGHASDDEGFAGPFRNARELLAAGFPERGAWPARRGLAGLAAVEFVEARSPDGLLRSSRCWVFGDEVVRNYLGVKRVWFQHKMTEEDRARFRRELDDFLHGEPEADERDLSLAAARATGLEIATVDYARAEDGNLVVFEVNPYPSLMAWWASDLVQQRRIVDALARLLERTAATA